MLKIPKKCIKNVTNVKNALNKFCNYNIKYSKRICSLERIVYDIPRGICKFAFMHYNPSPSKSISIFCVYRLNHSPVTL